MTSIGSMAANNQLMNLLLRTQARIQDLQTQVTTEQRSQSYGGLGADAQALLTAEAMRASLERFERDNGSLKVRLEAQQASVNQANTIARDFRAHLEAAASRHPMDADVAAELQGAAFRALKGMEAALNADIDGRYVFAGSRASTRPASIEGDTLSAFQKRFDGAQVVFPPTRAAAVGTRTTLPPEATGGLNFDATSGAISAGSVGAFAALEVGSTIEIAGSAGNDGRYTIVTKSADDSQLFVDGAFSVGATTITITAALTDEAASQATLSVDNWFGGDSLPIRRRLDDDREVALDVSAVDPGFEKAIRAMATVAQGDPSGPGSLVLNPDRIEAALALINNALDRNSGGSPPYGAEVEGVMDDTAMTLGYASVMLEEASEAHGRLIANLNDRIHALKTVDQTSVIAELLDRTRGLEASFQALARIRELSLTNYLR